MTLFTPVILTGTEITLLFCLFAVTILLIVTIIMLKPWKNLKNGNKKSKQLEKSFLGIIDSTKDAFILFEENEYYAHSNESGRHFLNAILGLNNLKGLKINDVFNQLNQYKKLPFRSYLDKAEKLEINNLEITGVDGSVKSYYLRINPIKNEGKINYTYLLTRDITEEIANINKVNEHGYIISEIMTFSRDGYLIIDNEYNVKAVNPKALSFLSMEEDAMVGKSLLTLFPELENSELITNCEFALLQQEPMEFDFFFVHRSEWYNIKIQPNKYGLTLFFYENSLSKLTTCANEAERKALEEFSKREISFYQIMAKSIDEFQVMFPGMFCAIYSLNDTANELKYFSSGYSTFLPTVPRAIKFDFPGFDMILKTELNLERTNLYFDFLSDLFANDSFNTIMSQPIYSDNKTQGVILFYFKQDVHDHPRISSVKDKISAFVEKIFNYRGIFRELEKLSIVSENSQKAYATINIEEQITWSNKSFSELFKKNREDIYLRNITEIINEQNTSLENYVSILDSIHNFSNLNITFPFTVSSNEIRQIHLTTRTIFSGDAIQLLIEIEDITEQSNYEKRLLEGQKFLKNITDTVPIILFQCIIDPQGQFNLPFISKEIERLDLGASIDKILKRPELIFGLVHPDDLGKIISSIEMAQRNLLIWNVEFRIRSRSGRYIWINGVGVHERTEDGSYLWNGYLENITDKKEKIKEIEEVNARFAFASKAVNEVIWELDLQTDTMKWSDGLTTIFGYSKEFYPVKENLKDYIHPDDFLKYQEEIETNKGNKNKELFSTEYRFKKADGHYADVMDRAFILRDENGDSQRIIGSIKDVSETRLFEKKKKELINETQEFERNQFSMELHDGLAQQLVALNLYLSHLESDLEPHQRERIDMCKRIVLDSLNQTRTLCYNLSPPELSNGLVSGIKSLFDRLTVLSGKQFHLEFDPTIEPEIYNNIDIYNIYRIVQEFINNSLKHSECTEINCAIGIKRRSKSLIIQIQDNGKGYDFASVKFGFGIQNMQKRANLANATIKMNSFIGEGSSLTITV